MKKLYVIVFIFLSTSIFAQNKQNILSKFDTSGMETSVLYQKTPIININNYNEATINSYSFFQAYKAIKQSDLLQRFSPLQNLKEQSKQSYFTNIIPLVILHSDYETISESAFQNQTVTNDADGYLIRTNTNQAIFEKQSITLATPLRVNTKGLQTTFKLTSNNIYNTTNNTIESIEINFDDGLGFKTIVLNQDLTVNYATDGEKILVFKLTLNNGEIITRKSKLKINYSNLDLQTSFNRMVTSFTSSITPDLSIYNESTSYPGIGEYELFLSSDNILDKPIFLVDGFDPLDGRDITGLYELLDFNGSQGNQNLGDLVRAEGFDLVILNFPVYTRAADNAIIDGGADFIERNAMLLVELINIINAQKVGNEPNVVIGPSMGGLISRYALNYMENQSLNHDTRLWISFDSPHHGANVPIGFQHQFNFLAYGLNDFFFIGNQNVEELQPIVEGMLKSSAARQMLTDQLEAHFQSGSTVEFDNNLSLPQAHPFKTIFYNNMNALTTSGFPEAVRNVSIINGSGINSRYQDTNGSDLLPGRQIINTTFNITSGTDATLTVNFTPSAGNQINASHVYIDFAWWIPAFDVESNANSQAHNYSNGIDAGSGGLFDILKLTEGLDTTGLVGEFLGALQTDYFNFIPSVSGMAFEITNNEIDWFHTPSNIMTARTVNNITPFANWYMPDDNEPHVQLTEQNVEFALLEIMPETLTINSFTSETIKIKQNPIINNLTLLSTNTFENSKISIIDITGKLVFNTTKTINNTITIPLQLASGLYILNIESNDTILFKTKIIVK